MKMTERTEKANDVIFVGNKPPMSYVLAIITAFSAGAGKEITLKQEDKQSQQQLTSQKSQEAAS